MEQPCGWNDMQTIERKIIHCVGCGQIIPWDGKNDFASPHRLLPRIQQLRFLERKRMELKEGLLHHVELHPELKNLL